MRLFRLLLIVLLLASICTGCGKDNRVTINKAAWSSRAPFNIPLKRRIKEQEEGNKVINPSFERGRYFNDRLNTYELVGWTEVGNATEWVDADKPEYGGEEVSGGRHAVKIRREDVDEVVQEGSGMLSDYIKVIPGNYRLSYSIRLENISPYKERLGSRLEDAIDVRVYYYNKNKVRIGGSSKHPLTGKRFDNEFKALPFAGFWNIDRLDWTRVRGISHKFPFSDGDLPENTRYVRLFFGLKGAGTMWVDQVHFSFTPRNFSLYEKIRPWQDSTFTPYDLIIPRPKQMKPGPIYSLLDSSVSQSIPVIVIPRRPAPLVEEAAKLLQDELRKILQPGAAGGQLNIPMVDSLGAEEIQQSSIVFSLGNNALNKAHRSKLPYSNLPDNAQAYFIHQTTNPSPLVHIDGHQPLGVYYGATSLVQLLDQPQGQYHHADIIDYPDVHQRSVYCPRGEGMSAALDFLTSNRFNRIHLKVEPPYQTLDNQRMIREMGEASFHAALFIPGLSVRPYQHSPLKNFDPDNALAHEQKLYELVRYSRAHDFKRVLVRMDAPKGKGAPDSCTVKLTKDLNPQKYQNMLDVHTELIGNLTSIGGGETEVAYLPVWHNNACILKSHGRGELYLNELFKKVPERVKFLWTGAVGHPLIVDQSEVAYVRKRVGRAPGFFSLSIHPYGREEFLRAYPGKARMASLFRHFMLDLPKGLFHRSNNGFYADISPRDALDQIRLRTLAEYLWNADRFNPERALLRVLIAQYGKETAFRLIQFNDAYYGLYEMYQKVTTRESKVRYIRSAEAFKHQLEQHMSQLERDLANSSLIPLLAEYRNQARTYFQRLLDQ